MTSEVHRVAFIFGANVEAERNLPQALIRLKKLGRVAGISSVWETKAEGALAPNYLNMGLLFETHLDMPAIKQTIIRPLETMAGRVRGTPLIALDVDVLLVDETPYKLETWHFAFVLVPLAELLPDFRHPVSGEKLLTLAAQLCATEWVRGRAEVTAKCAEVLLHD